MGTHLMADDAKQPLHTQLWNIANTLRGKMGADELQDYILGSIFYKYLSERGPSKKRVFDRVVDYVATFIKGIEA